jgi:hypothetical protein
MTRNGDFPLDTKYRPADGIAWAVEATGIVVLDELGGRCLKMDYPKAAIWDLLAQGRTLDGIIGVARFIVDRESEDVGALVREHVVAWLQQGWIVPLNRQNHHGQHLDHNIV